MWTAVHRSVTGPRSPNGEEPECVGPEHEAQKPEDREVRIGFPK